MRSRRSASKPSSEGSVVACRTVSAVVIARDHRKRRRPPRRVGSRPVTALERPPDELRALRRLALAELADAGGGIGGGPPPVPPPPLPPPRPRPPPPPGRPPPGPPPGGAGPGR